MTPFLAYIIGMVCGAVCVIVWAPCRASGLASRAEERRAECVSVPKREIVDIVQDALATGRIKIKPRSVE